MKLLNILIKLFRNQDFTNKLKYDLNGVEELKFIRINGENNETFTILKTIKQI